MLGGGSDSDFDFDLEPIQGQAAGTLLGWPELLLGHGRRSQGAVLSYWGADLRGSAPLPTAPLGPLSVLCH